MLLWKIFYICGFKYWKLSNIHSSSNRYVSSFNRVFPVPCIINIHENLLIGWLFSEKGKGAVLRQRQVSSVFRFVSSSLLTYFLNRLFWMSSNMATILFSTSSSGIVTFAPVSLLTVTHWRCCISLGPTSRRIGTPCMRHRHTWIEITKRVRTILQVKYFINDHHYIMVIIILFMTLSSQWLNFHPGE